MAWLENNVKVKAPNYLGPSGLAASELLGGHEVFKITVVGIHNGMESVQVALQIL
jgi:hypothetical protein